MQISVSLLPAHVDDSSEIDLAVVIDVLRATSVMATALAAGAKQIITCQEIDQARQLALDSSGEVLLCGERNCRIIDGFDLGNSPSEYDAEQVTGKTLVMTTTNGTAAVEATRRAHRVITAAFVNLSATIAAIGDTPNVHLVCAGTNGAVTAEDVLLAGAVVDRCVEQQDANLVGDEAILARQLWRSWFETDSPSIEALVGRLSQTQGGRNLIEVGYEKDLNRCATIDTVSTVPQRINRQPAIFQASG